MKGPLKNVAELVRRESGISLKPAQRRSLEAAIRRALPGGDAAGFLEHASDPLTRADAVQRLLDEVTIQETAFLRDRSQLEVIDWEALRDSADGAIRIWVAGCATGEEAYTLALLACESFATDDPPVSVLGTDISEAALKRAREGRYRRRATANVPAAIFDRYFVKKGTGSAVGDILRRPVQFARHNLARDPMPPAGETAFDLVVCRNVLIYFEAAVVEHVLAGLEASLRPGGTLLLGAADALHGVTRQLDDATPRPAPPEPVPKERADPEGLLAAALEAAGGGRRAEALETVSRLLSDEPLNAQAHLVRGMIELEAGAATAAAASFRSALSVDPGFGLCAFNLGRAHDALGERRAASKAYEQALETLDPGDDRHERLLGQVDLKDIAAACRERIGALR